MNQSVKWIACLVIGLGSSSGFDGTNWELNQGELL